LVPRAESAGDAVTGSNRRRTGSLRALARDVRPALLGILMLAAPAARAEGQLDGTDLQARIGIAVVAADGSGCVTFQSEALQGGVQVVLVDPSRPPAIAAGEILGPASAACAGPIPQPADASYRLGLLGDSSGEARVYVAVLTRPGAVVFGARGPTADLDGDGTPEVFRVCASAEGLHFTVWSGRALEGVRRWHRYFYLGYDVEANCQEADYVGTDPGGEG
jgi:hypothetical protein